MAAPGYGLTRAVGAFPLWEDVDFLGGFQVQPTSAARDAIPLLNQKVGMTCYVIETTTTYRLTATGSPGTWAALPSGFTAGGDLGGSSTSQSVLKVNGVAISGTPSAGYQLVASSASAAAWAPAPSGFTAGGDLSGTSTSQTVAKVNGIAVSGTPAAGYVLTATGTTAATWQTAPSGFTAGGDLSGSSTSQTVVKVNGVAVSGTAAAGYSLLATSAVAAAWTAPAATPTGTGFTHYVAGVRDAAAKLVDLTADVTNALPVASVSGFNTAVDGRITNAIPTGTGFSHITGGVRDAAAKLVSLVTDIDTTTLLPGPNGGGVPSTVKQFTTTDATPTSVTETATTLTAFQAGDFLATVIARTGAGAMFRVELLATYVANAGGPVVLTQVNPPTLQNAFGALSGLVITYVVSAGVVTMQVTGLAATTIYWDIVQIARVV